MSHRNIVPALPFWNYLSNRNILLMLLWELFVNLKNLNAFSWILDLAFTSGFQAQQTTAISGAIILLTSSLTSFSFFMQGQVDTKYVRKRSKEKQKLKAFS
jgi:hypothetical protein